MAKKHYDHTSVEEKWQKAWEGFGLFQDQPVETPKDKDYLLFAFAYPSGSGLHVGHVESKTALDILARFSRMNGKQVFFPVGWDAFGLPAENYAIKTGTPPAVTTQAAIDTFRGQIKRLGVSYDWANEIATNHPEYYRWTQWLFLQLYEKGLAYRGQGMVNWCPQDQTVLANEQVVDGRCERCGAEVMQKELEQWYFRITQYQEELLSGLEEVDWPEATKQHQRHWIGKSEGVEVAFPLQGTDLRLTCFTTRIDTIFGVTFVVISPEKFVELGLKSSVPGEKQGEVEAYVEQSFKKTEEERKIGEKDKTGVDTGLKVLNPVNGEEVPLFVADYVLAGYGTGVVMGVPAHDERDGEFARKFGLPIRQAIDENGELIESGTYTGLKSTEAQEKLVADFSDIMHRTTTWKLRDWLISRQRYWGAPIPIVYDPEGKPHPVKEEHLPWTLPTDVDFKPTGESPLKSSKEFIERTERLYGPGWRPEFDTMDTFVDSSWYFLRYIDARNTEAFADPAKLNAWLPVDLYLIGPEHIVLHLLYSRFFTKFLRDEGYLKINEPFAKMRHQGMILGPDGKKMSKSKGNVINPDEIIADFGADTLRVYEMFMGPLEADKPWDARAVAGVSRFLNKIYSNVMLWQDQQPGDTDPELLAKLHQTIKKATEDLPNLKFNTTIAAMMEFLNLWQSLMQETDGQVISKDDLVAFLKILAPFVPFLAEELYAMVAQPSQDRYDGIHVQNWPPYDPELAKSETITLGVQVDGKLRAQLEVSADQVEDQSAVLENARALEEIQKWIDGKEIVKEIYVPGRIVSFVTK